MEAPGTVRPRADPWAFAGIGALAVAAFLYGWSAVAVPSWLHSLVMPLVWLLLLVLATRWFTPHPRRVAVLGLLAYVAWFGLLLA
jgi:hypothetical protein